jgi:hypothetical protein
MYLHEPTALPKYNLIGHLHIGTSSKKVKLGKTFFTAKYKMWKGQGGGGEMILSEMKGGGGVGIPEAQSIVHCRIRFWNSGKYNSHLNGVGDVRDYLDCSAQVVASPLLVDHMLVNFAWNRRKIHQQNRRRG